VDDVISDINGTPFSVTGLPPMRRHGRFGGYLNFLQQLTHPSESNPKAGLSAILNAVVADDRTSTTDAQVAGAATLGDNVRKRRDCRRRLEDTHRMEPDHEARYRALSTRDARFDGRFFIAVRFELLEA